jgi:hypothetical protein
LLVFFVSFKIDDLGGCRGDTMQALARWQYPVAFSDTLNVVHWAMRSVLYRRIRMVNKITSKIGVLFCIVDFVVINILR